MGIKKYDSSKLNSRERMLICNHEGVFTDIVEKAFAKLLGVTPSDIRWLVPPSVIFKARGKLRKEIKR